MKATRENLTGPDIIGVQPGFSAQEILSTLLRKWRHRLGFCSIIAAIPAVLASNLPTARSEPAKKLESANVGEQLRRRASLRPSCSTSSLLKRQSAYLLPHQQGTFDPLTTSVDFDNCPGREIPAGTYTTAAPFTVSGDTTGANNTIGRVGYYYCYYSQTTSGPDHIYAFTLTSLGANPRIEVSRTSGSYTPVIYILDGRRSFKDGSPGCPAGTNKTMCDAALAWRVTPQTTINSDSMRFLPLNTPLHLGVDSEASNNSGTYTVRMEDVTIARSVYCNEANPLECDDFFLRQQYRDFLGREPDPPGFTGWMNILKNCGTSVPQPCDRIEVASAFFRSSEFQGRGYFLYRFYSSVGRIPVFSDFQNDHWYLDGFQTNQQLEANKAAFASDFTRRTEFQNRYGATFDNPTAYVDALLQTVGLPNHPTRQSWINSLQGNNTTATRAQVLRSLVESAEVYQKYYNEAFVIMMYFGFLHRTADAAYVQWIQTMNQSGGDYRVMINGFLNSPEYRRRFGP